MVRVDGSGQSGSLIQVRGLDKTYRRGGEDDSRPAGLESRRRQGRLRGLHGAERFGQDHSAQSARRPRRSHARHHHRRRRRNHAHVRQQAHRVARAPRRLHLPDVQPDSGAHRVSERRAAAAADQALEGRAPQARGDRARRRGAGRPHEPLSAPAFRRTGTACGHCPRDRRRSHVPALRRAHRRPRPQERRRNHGSDSASGEGVRQDRADGDARSGGRPPGRYHASSRKGRAGRIASSVPRCVAGGVA